MDEIDLANEHSEMYRQQALRAHLRGVKDITVVRESGGPGRHATAAGPGPKAICIDCGERIPPARIAANPAAVRCIGCQEREERGHGLG